MTRRAIGLVAFTIALHASAFAAPIAHASPGIRTLEEHEVERDTDLHARLRVVAVERTSRDGRIEVRSLVEVLDTRGRRARALRRGMRLTFRTSCRNAEMPQWMSGYPTDYCSASFWRMPNGLDRNGHTADVALRVSTNEAHERAFEVVARSWPRVGYALGELGDRRLARR